jgi:predicted RNA-binding protein
MCQATVFLNGREIMRDVLRVEPTPEGVRLYAFFEEPRVIAAVIQEIDLIKHRVMLASSEEETSQ